MKKRIIRPRACYRDKNVGKTPIKAKCRVVLSGFNDPDLADLQRNSPTTTRLSFYLLLQVFAAGFLCNEGRWKLASGDATAAFLQGQQSARSEPLYMYPPKDPIIAKSGYWQDSEIYEVVGNIYGLVNAPYEWCMEVMRRMYDLGFVSHSLDVLSLIHI